MKLVKDTNGSGKVDGVSHIKPHLVIKAAVGLIIWIVFSNFYALAIAMVCSTIGLFIFWILSELKQHRRMVKLGRYKSSQDRHRVQDILIPTLSGLPFDIILVLIWWFS